MRAGLLVLAAVAIPNSTAPRSLPPRPGRSDLLVHGQGLLEVASHWDIAFDLPTERPDG